MSGPARLTLRIAPGARRSEVVGRHGAAIRIKVAAPPMDGKANAALLAFLAERLQIAPRSLTLAAGEKSRDKVVEVQGLTLQEAETRLLAAVENQAEGVA